MQHLSYLIVGTQVLKCCQTTNFTPTHESYNIMHVKMAGITRSVDMLRLRCLTAELGSSFATVPVPSGPAMVQLAVPQV
jgi:hypothetical protein